MSQPVVVSRIQNRRGTQDQFDALYPPGYSGIGGFGSIPGFNITNYPNVLLSGEMGLCTDSRRLFMGNINGEYIELAQSAVDSISLQPLVLSLPRAVSFTLIPQLTYSATPFMNFIYSITDAVGTDWTSVGTGFSRNAELQITALGAPNATLTDIGTEINNLSPSGISFKAEYDISGQNIEIFYKHNFSSNLMFSLTTLKWIAF